MSISAITASMRNASYLAQQSHVKNSQSQISFAPFSAQNQTASEKSASVSTSSAFGQDSTLQASLLLSAQSTLSTATDKALLSSNQISIQQGIEEGIAPSTSEEFSLEVLAKIKSGMSFADALLEVKSETFELHFKEELAQNGGDVQGALERAKAKLSAVTEVSEEDMYAVVEDLAASYAQAQTSTQSSELQTIVDALSSYLEGLETTLGLADVAKVTADGQIENEQSEHAKDMQDVFLEAVFASSSVVQEKNTSQESLTAQDQRERDKGIKHYKQVASYIYNPNLVQGSVLEAISL